jgi:hypothetical protein
MDLTTSRGIKWPFQVQALQAQELQAQTKTEAAAAETETAAAETTSTVNRGARFSKRVHGSAFWLSWPVL